MDDILPSELRQILRLSLRLTGAEIGTLKELAPKPRTPAARRLVEKILFSRTFIWTYYGVLGGILLLYISLKFCTSQHHKRWRNHQLKDGRESSPLSSESPASSSSTTLAGTDSPPNKDVDPLESERLPLLAQQRPHNLSSGLWHRTRAFLLRQPRPVPAVTAPRNDLPTNGTTILILGLLALNVFYLLFQVPLSVPMLFVLADRAALCFVANLPLLYLLAAKNNQPLKYLTGWSYEGLNIFHRRIGEWMTFLAVLHTIGMFGVWYTVLRPFHFTLWHFLTLKIILLGIFAFLAYVLIYATSTGYFRAWFYEGFLVVHIVLQVAALVLLFFHHHGSRPFVIAALAVWMLDRVLARLLVSSTRLVADLEVAPDGQTVLLFCQIPISRNHGMTLSIRNGWKAGQHVFVSVPGIGWTHRLQAHPFTIASPAPPNSQHQGKWPLQLIIRAKDGFSKDLLNYARFHQHTEILLDGPYGSTEYLDSMENTPTYLIAGGSGIAVTYPLSWFLRAKNPDGDPREVHSSRTVYVNGSKHIPQWTTTPSGKTSTVNECTHLWVRQHTEHDSWITMRPCLQPEGRDQAAQVLDLIDERFTTQTSQGRRPDMDVELRDWVGRRLGTGKDQSLTSPKLATRKLATRKQSFCVVVSGPDGLVRDVRNTVSRLVREGYSIDIHVEKFGW